MVDEEFGENGAKELEEIAEKEPDQSPAEKGIAYLQSIIDRIEKLLKDNGMENVDFDTNVVYGDIDDTIKIKGGKVVFGDGKTLREVLKEVSPFALAKYLLLAEQVVQSFVAVSKEKDEREQELEAFGQMFG